MVDVWVKATAAVQGTVLSSTFSSSLLRNVLIFVDK